MQVKGTTFFASELARGNHAQVIETSRSWLLPSIFSGFPQGNDVGELGNVIFCQKPQSTTTLLWIFNDIKMACALFGFQLELCIEKMVNIKEVPTSLQM